MARTVGSAADQTRQRILDVAKNLVLRHGYHGTSVRDISEALSMTKGALYYHFASKDEILEALVAPMIDELAESVAEFRAAGRPTAPLLGRLVDHADRHAPLLRAMMGDPSVARCEPLRDRVPALMTELMYALGGGTDDASALRGRCALGVIHAGVMAPRDLTAPAHPQARLTPREKAYVTDAVLAVLAAGD